MGQISFKISETEMEFLRWYSEETSNSMSTIYRDITFDTYKKWKITVILQLYAAGKIGFKHLCRMADISFTEGLLLIEENEIEPPIPESVDDYTSKVAKRISKGLKKEG